MKPGRMMTNTATNPTLDVHTKSDGSVPLRMDIPKSNSMGGESEAGSVRGSKSHDVLPIKAEEDNGSQRSAN